jgi:hypothetical protein
MGGPTPPGPPCATPSTAREWLCGTSNCRTAHGSRYAIFATEPEPTDDSDAPHDGRPLGGQRHTPRALSPRNHPRKRDSSEQLRHLEPRAAWGYRPIQSPVHPRRHAAGPADVRSLIRTRECVTRSAACVLAGENAGLELPDIEADPRLGSPLLAGVASYWPRSERFSAASVRGGAVRARRCRLAPTRATPGKSLSASVAASRPRRAQTGSRKASFRRMRPAPGSPRWPARTCGPHAARWRRRSVCR